MNRMPNFAIALFLMCFLLESGCKVSAPAPEFVLEDAAYVWQRLWNDDVRESLENTSVHVEQLMVLAAEAETEPIAIDWSALSKTGKPVTLVFRYPRMAGAVEYAKHVFDDVERTWANAEAAGATPVGVQLDFDSPTSKLLDYAALLRSIRPKLSVNTALSVTALPTWLGSADFQEVAWVSPMINGIRNH